MAKEANAPKAAPAAPAPSTTTQTSPGTVGLVIHEKQAFTRAVELDGYTFEKGADPVDVPVKDAERLLARRDEHGRKYVKEA